MKVIYEGKADERLFMNVAGELIKKTTEANKDVVYLDCDLSACLGLGAWQSDRKYNCGIAEGNMIGIASGLASQGFKPICHTFGAFASRRVFDQVFLSAAYSKNDITVFGSDAGVTAAFNGGTHQPFEDVALYRTIPTATVIDVTDNVLFESIFPKSFDIPGVKYFRFARKGNKVVYAPGSDFEIGKGVVAKDGKDVTIIATGGVMVPNALEAAEKLGAEGIDAAVIDMFTIKPLDAELVLKYAESTGAIVTAENHSVIGGLYSAVADLLTAKKPTPVEAVGVKDRFGEVGPQSYLEETLGLTPDDIVAAAKAAIARK